MMTGMYNSFDWVAVDKISLNRNVVFENVYTLLPMNCYSHCF